MPPGWKVVDTGTSYGGIVLAQPANPSDPPTIVAQVSKLTGNVDPAKLLEYAPGDLQGLPGYDGHRRTGVHAGRLSGMAVGRRLHQERRETDRRADNLTESFPSQGAVFVLELDADSADSDQGVLNDAVNIIDDQTTITLP